MSVYVFLMRYPYGPCYSIALVAFCILACMWCVHLAASAWVLQHSATQCNAVLCSAPHWNAVHRSATQCIAAQRSATQSTEAQHFATQGNTAQHTAAHCNILQHTATHCSILRHSPAHIFHAYKYMLTHIKINTHTHTHTFFPSTLSHCFPRFHFPAFFLVLSLSLTHSNSPSLPLSLFYLSICLSISKSVCFFVSLFICLCVSLTVWRTDISVCHLPPGHYETVCECECECRCMCVGERGAK